MFLRFRGIGVLPPESPRRAPMQTDVSFPKPSLMFIEVPGKKSRPPLSPLRLLWGELPVSRTLFT